MAKKRFIVVRSLERWHARAQEEVSEQMEASKGQASPLDRLADYAQNPVSSTCLVLMATKIDGRRKLMTAARKGGWLVACEPLARGALPPFILREARTRGHAIDPQIADLLAEIAGPELASVVDALERLSLYVGEKQPLTEDAIAACLVLMRQSTVGQDQRRRAPRADPRFALEDVCDRDRPAARVVWLVGPAHQVDAAPRAGATPKKPPRRAKSPSALISPRRCDASPFRPERCALLAEADPS
jgi:DNA polymerase-3 subunit delta